MTREEAIKTIRELWRETNDSWYEETYKMAIEALKAPSGDLISRQWLLDVYGDYIGDNGEPKYYVPLEVVRQNIKDAPSADADVVRCKDCRFWKNEHLCLVMSRYGSIDTKAEHYCSWGERREE